MADSSNSVTASVLAFTNTAPLQIGNGQYKVNGTLDEVVFYNHRPDAARCVAALPHRA